MNSFNTQKLPNTQKIEFTYNPSEYCEIDNGRIFEVIDNYMIVFVKNNIFGIKHIKGSALYDKMDEFDKQKLISYIKDGTLSSQDILLIKDHLSCKCIDYLKKIPQFNCNAIFIDTTSLNDFYQYL